MTDVRMHDTVDGGEITIRSGVVDMGPGLETSAYLSLFGGNVEDSGIEADDPRQWWGNLTEADRSRHQRSETQHVLATLPLTSASLRRIEDAARRDLEWMTESVADSVEVEATVPGLNRVAIDIEIAVGDQRYRLRFEEEWRAS